MKYLEQLQTQEWKAKRQEIIERDKKCQICGANNNLQVHHLIYLKNRLAWEYPNELLIVLCEKCHKKEHFFRKKLENKIKKMLIAGLTSEEILDILKIYTF